MTDITLRDDQLDAVHRLRRAMVDYQSVLLHAECGWGKTVASAYMASGAHAKRKRVIFGVHRRELARQTAKTFDRFGIRYGFIAAGMRRDPFALVQIASHGTLMNRPELWNCDLFVPDEAHLWANGKRAEMIAGVRAHGAHIVPLTATPEQGSGVGLANIADHIVHGPNVAWLIERGHLARYKAFAPVAPDMSGLHTRAGDYITSELEDRFSKPTVIGDRVAAYRRFASGKRMIGYCYSRSNGGETAATFRNAGIAAEFLDGETPDDQRCNVIGAFADGRVRVLVNCQLFREGFDLSAQVGRTVPIQAAAFWCPTQSLPLAVQMMMRPLRPQPEPAILLDHVNLLATHGLPDDEREWTLEGVPKKDREAAIMTMRCPSCFGTVRPARICPECGHEMKTDADGNMKLGGRVVKEVAGEIVEVDVEALRRARKQEINAARSLDALVELAKVRGYKVGWILNTMKARGGDVPTFHQVEKAMRA